MKKVGVSFKDKEMDLYNFLMEQISPSAYIKQLLKEQIKKEKEDNPKAAKRNNFDF